MQENGEWERLVVRAVARTPIAYARPWRLLHPEMAADLPPDALPGDRPVVVFPGALHGALGRELAWSGEGDWLRTTFEGGRPTAADLLFDPPEVPPGGEDPTMLRVGRPPLETWNPPEALVAYGAGEPFSFAVWVRHAPNGNRQGRRSDLIRALERAGSRGFGPRLAGRRGRFDLTGAEVRRMGEPFTAATVMLRF